MISQILSVGDKTEFIHKKKRQPYKSKIMDITEEEMVHLSFPAEENTLVLLEKNWHLELTFYCKKGIYRCQGVVVDRYKEGNFYLVIVRITSELERIQRRQFYKLAYSMEIEFQEAAEETLRGIAGENWNKGTTIDISGGGCRFNSRQFYQEETLLNIRFYIELLGNCYKQIWLGKVTVCHKIPNRQDIFETRVEFLDVERQKREQLVKFIFEEERKIRRKERSMDN